MVMEHTISLAFDFDGTICKSDEAFTEEINKLASLYKFKKIDLRERDTLRDLKTQEMLDRMGIPGWKLPVLIPHVRRKVRKRMSELQCYDGILNALEDLKYRGFRIGVLTSNSKKNVEEFFERVGFYPDFIEGDIGLFSKAKKLRRFKNSSRGPCYYVGDEVRDIEASQKAGVPCIAVTWGHNSRGLLEKASPFMIIDSSKELLEAF